MTYNNHKDRLESLMQFLEQDPENQTLLRDAAECAVWADDVDCAEMVINKLEKLGVWTNADRNSHAVALMRTGKTAQARDLFEELFLQQPDDLSLTFNLAWARALVKDYDGARALLREELVHALPQAAMLDIQLLHDAGDFDAAAERARAHLETHPSYEPLLAAISVLALDVEDSELARYCAEKSASHPDGLTSLGTLTLGEDEPAKAQALFEQALEMNDQSPRALIGLGLAKLVQGQAEQAGALIDKGAGLFESHLGSWIASGWSYLLAGNHALARNRFEHAFALDDTFAEAHGSLAVIDVLDGDLDAAQKKIQVAQRLDRACFSAAYAHVLIAAGQGDQEKVERIMELALKQPIGDRGGTLGQAIAKMAQ